MAGQNNNSVTSNENKNNISGGNKQPENPARGAAGLPDISAENFDDRGDPEGIQLGIATHSSADFLNTGEQELPSEHEKLNDGEK